MTAADAIALLATVFTVLMLALALAIAAEAVKRWIEKGTHDDTR